jgi:putative redox protein
VTSGPPPEPPPTAVRRRRVRGHWQGDYRVELVVRDGRFTLASDQGPEEGGEDSGPMPSELLFASAASCFAMAVAWSARKRRLALPDLEVVVSWGYDSAERTYDDIEIEARSSLATDAPEQFRALIRLAEEVCWVTRTIRRGRPIVVRAVARE